MVWSEGFTPDHLPELAATAQLGLHRVGPDQLQRPHGGQTLAEPLDNLGAIGIDPPAAWAFGPRTIDRVLQRPRDRRAAAPEFLGNLALALAPFWPRPGSCCVPSSVTSLPSVTRRASTTAAVRGLPSRRILQLGLMQEISRDDHHLE